MVNVGNARTVLICFGLDSCEMLNLFALWTIGLFVKTVKKLGDLIGDLFLLLPSRES